MRNPRRLAALLIAAGAAGVAVATAGAAWEASAANGEWQESVRVQSKVTGRTIEITRYLYEVEAPQAFDVAILTVQAATPAGRGPGSPDAVRRRTAGKLAGDLARTGGMSAANKLVADPRYRTADGGYDVGLRLLDLQRAEWSPADDPALATAAGDAVAGRTRLWTTAMVLALIPSLAGMGLWSRILLRHSEPPDIGLGAPSPPGAAPPAGSTPPAGPTPPADPDSATGSDVSAGPAPRLVAGFALGFGVLATVFTAVQIRAGLEENAAFAAAGRHAAQVTATAAGGGVRQAFRANALFEVGLLDRHRAEQAAEPGAGAAARAAAEATAVNRLTGIATSMAAPPDRAGGLAEPLHAVVTATLADAVAAAGQQHSGVAAADRAGARSNTMVIALFAVTAAAVLLDVAVAARARFRRNYLRLAVACAGLAVVVAVTQPL